MNVAGFSLSNWMTYGFSFLDGSISWRFPIAFQLVFSIILLSTVPWLPESPRWLLAQGRVDEGVAVLVALEGDHVDSQSDSIVHQRDSILHAVRAETEVAVSWKYILSGNTGNTGMIRRVCLGAGESWDPDYSHSHADLGTRNAMDAAARWSKRYQLLVRLLCRI